MLGREMLRHRLRWDAGERMAHIGKEGADAFKLVGEIGTGEGRAQGIGARMDHGNLLGLPVLEMPEPEECGALRNGGSTDRHAVENLLDLLEDRWAGNE